MHRSCNTHEKKWNEFSGLVKAGRKEALER
jgi:hypothetical protein